MEPTPWVAPAWKLATITSASPLLWSPSLSSPATRLTASTGSPKSISAMPPGLTSDFVSSVTAPMTATFTPWTVNVAYSGSTGFSVPLA